jgi:hypothetical protein
VGIGLYHVEHLPQAGIYLIRNHKARHAPTAITSTTTTFVLSAADSRMVFSFPSPNAPAPSKPVIKPNANLRATSGTLSSCQTTKRQNPSHFRRRVLSRDFLHVAVLMDGFTIFVHHGVRFKAHRFAAYAAEQRLFAHASPPEMSSGTVIGRSGPARHTEFSVFRSTNALFIGNVLLYRAGRARAAVPKCILKANAMFDAVQFALSSLRVE